MKKVKLICFPYAGGSSAIYSKWRQHLNGGIELIPVELSGHGRRFGEPLYDSIEKIKEDVLEALKEENIEEAALFGHSLGSIIAYEVAHELQAKLGVQPKHIFFSGKKAPHFDEREEYIHKLPEHEFKRKVIELGGTPRDVFENEELFDLFLPILRADFTANEAYSYKEKGSRLNSDITVISGTKEDIGIEEILGWKEHTSKSFRAHKLDGDHFFINSSYKAVIDIINKTLEKEKGGFI